MAILYLITLLLMSCTEGLKFDNRSYSVQVDSSANYVHNANKRVYNDILKSSVKVLPPNGHGTGSILYHKGIPYVLTAYHVIQEDIYNSYIEYRGTKYQMEPVYLNSRQDVALLKFKTHFSPNEKVKLRLSRDYEGGQQIVFSGFPSHYKNVLSVGNVMGFAKNGDADYLVVQSLAWFGSSGSVVFNEKGEVVGVVSAVDYTDYPWPTIKENMVLVSKIPEDMFSRL